MKYQQLLYIFEAGKTPNETDKPTDDSAKVDKKGPPGEDEGWTPPQGQEEESETIGDMEEKFGKISTEAVKQFQEYFNVAPNAVISSIDVSGFDKTVSTFVNDIYIKNITDNDVKMFVVINKDDFTEFLIDKIREVFIGKDKKTKKTKKTKGKEYGPIPKNQSILECYQYQQGVDMERHQYRRY